uniref:Uncharacterized protein n=1 Tax=viral metagenome TaxID=1070528 RepID=A0A6C0ASW9_9ZZZZ
MSLPTRSTSAAARAPGPRRPLFEKMQAAEIEIQKNPPPPRGVNARGTRGLPRQLGPGAAAAASRGSEQYFHAPPPDAAVIEAGVAESKTPSAPAPVDADAAPTGAKPTQSAPGTGQCERDDAVRGGAAPTPTEAPSRDDALRAVSDKLDTVIALLQQLVHIRGA